MTSLILRLALLLLGFALLPSVAISPAWGQGEAPHKRRVPPGYVRVAHGEWDWASRAGHYSPPRWLIDQVDRDLREIQQGLGLRTRGRPVVIYCHDRAEFSRAVTELGGKSPAAWVQALAFPARAIMVIDGSRNPVGRAETITHELVHVVLGMVGDVPRWYHEGLAQWLSGEQPDPKAVTTVNGFAFNDQIASFRDLERFFPKTH